MQPKTIYRLLVPSLIIFSCASSSKISNQNLSFLYPISYSRQLPKIRLVHFSDDSSTLYANIIPGHLKFVEEAINRNPVANVVISIHFFESYNSKKPTDSISIQRSLLLSEFDDNEYLFTVNVNTKYKNGQLLEMAIINQDSPYIIKNYLLVDRSSINCSQNYLIKNANDRKLLFSNYTSEGSLYISHNSDHQVLKVTYYNHDLTPAFPPYKSQKKVVFGQIRSRTMNISNGSTLDLSRNGVYYIQADSTIQAGLTILKFHDDFPNITTSKQMINTIRYIIKNEEYKKMLASKEIKLAIDEFWLKIGGNKDRAKVLIKEYYRRVRYANKYFTSFKEGWRTDRGLIFIIYGHPDIIYKNDHSENWIYNAKATEPILSFFFMKENDPFSNNHFNLFRDAKFENSWNIAIHRWRHGRVNERHNQ